LHAIIPSTFWLSLLV
jgi:hypothetical protein